MNKELAEAIKSLRPTAEFSFTGDDYSSIKWDVLEGAAPTLSQIKAEVTRLAAVNAKHLEDKAAARIAIADRLGITQDELSLLLA
jgi:hypothetical protein